MSQSEPISREYLLRLFTVMGHKQDTMPDNYILVTQYLTDAMPAIRALDAYYTRIESSKAAGEEQLIPAAEVHTQGTWMKFPFLKIAAENPGVVYKLYPFINYPLGSVKRLEKAFWNLVHNRGLSGSFDKTDTIGRIKLVFLPYKQHNLFLTPFPSISRDPIMQKVYAEHKDAIDAFFDKTTGLDFSLKSSADYIESGTPDSGTLHCAYLGCTYDFNLTPEWARATVHECIVRPNPGTPQYGRGQSYFAYHREDPTSPYVHTDGRRLRPLPPTDATEAFYDPDYGPYDPAVHQLPKKDV